MKKYSLIVKQFIVLSMFIIIPVISITAISNYAIRSYAEEEISKSGISKLEVSERIIALISDTIKNDTINLSLNERLNYVNGIHNIQSALEYSENYYMLSQMQSMLSELVRTNSLYSSIYIYPDDSDYIITSDGVFLKDEFSDKNWIATYDIYKKLNQPVSWLTPRSTGINGNNYILSYIFPLKPYTTKLRGSIAINIYEKSLSKLINSNNSQNGDYIDIIYPNGDVISSVDKSILISNISNKDYIAKLLKSEQTKGYFNETINNKMYLITYNKTTFNNWIYVGVFSLDSFNSKIKSLKLTIIYISIGLLLLGVISSYILSRKLYNPVKKLVQEIQSRKGTDIISNDNEVTLLSKAFINMIKEEDQLFNNLEKSKKYLRESYLLGLLRGQIINTEEHEELFAYKYFLCCIIYIDKYKDFVSNFSYEQQYLLKTAILNLTEEIIGSAYTCLGLVMEGEKIAVIINTDNSDVSQAQEVLKQSFMIVQSEAKKVIETTVTVSISNMYDDILKVRTCYQEAQNLIRHRFIAGYEQIISNRYIIANSNKYYYPFNFEKQILNNVEIGSKSALINSLSDLITEIKSTAELSYDNVMLILNQLIGNTLKYLFSLNLSVDKVFGNDFNIYFELAENETLDEAGLFLSNIYLQIIEYCDKSKLDNKSHIAKIMEYIQGNYKKDIAINTLADYVGLSYSHVRKIFNEETGENIVNYINNMRIEEAKRLLCQSNMNINDIALSLGYNNKQSFNRFFKKFVGINPGEYRTIKAN